MKRADFKSANRFIVKVGTALLTRKDNHINPSRIKQVVAQIAQAKKEEKEIVLVTSGAVGIGLGMVGSTVYPNSLSARQALAAMGQSRLMHLYETFFQAFHIKIGQVLLTAHDIQSRENFINVKNTLLKLLSLGVVPIINENDTVSIEEIKFGDNDTLSANVSLLAEADLLVILTDTAGVYNKNPKRHAGAQRIRIIRKIDKRILRLAKNTDSKTAIGGMETKINAARIATASGIPVVIASGQRMGVLQRILKGEDVGTLFVPAGKRLSQKQQWIAHARRKRGGIVIDRGCKQAVLKRGTSILPVGVMRIRGPFKKGDCIGVYDEAGREIGIGLSNYHSNEFERMMGRRRYDEIIHCDNLVLTGADEE